LRLLGFRSRKIRATLGGQVNQRAAETAAGVQRRFIFGGQKNAMTEKSARCAGAQGHLFVIPSFCLSHPNPEF
jgi:hypothetical protein